MINICFCWTQYQDESIKDSGICVEHLQYFTETRCFKFADKTNSIV